MLKEEYVGEEMIRKDYTLYNICSPSFQQVLRLKYVKLRLN